MAQPCGHCRQPHPAHVSVCPVTGERISPFTLVNEDEILVGSVVGERYHLRDVLGQGTTGTVFAVEHLALPRPAAMKVLRPRYSPLDSVVRVFHGEARTAFTVSQACLPEIFDVGQLPDGSPYFVMERLQGETLARRIRRERLSLAAAVDVAMQILSALETIHARDLLLRDLRPQNVFLSHRRGCRPVVKILDFGLARLVPLERVRQAWESLVAPVGAGDANGVLAIPYYLSPERARSEHDVEPASDLFVTGTILYEALTGHRPFHGTSLDELLLAIAEASPAPMRELRPEIPVDLDNLVLRTLSASPRTRPASARELQDELREIFDGARRGRSGSGSLSIPVPRSMPVSATPLTKASSSDRTLEAVDVQERSPPSLTVTNETRAPLDAPEAGLEATHSDARFADANASLHAMRTAIGPAARELEEATETSRAEQLGGEIADWRAADDDMDTIQISLELRARVGETDDSRPADASPPPTTREQPPDER